MTEALPEPKPGLVFRYRYLWKNDPVETSPKIRPVLAVAVERLPGDILRVVVVPISSQRPLPGDGVAIPEATKSRLRLTRDASWIVAAETNVFSWPGFDLEQTSDGKWAHGFVGEKLVDAVRKRLLGPPPAPQTERDDDSDDLSYRSAKP